MNSAILLTVMLILGTAVSLQWRGSLKCPDGCECMTSEGQLVVNCTELQLTEVPDNIPLETQWLDLSVNNIQKVRPAAFKNLKNLTTLVLSSNNMDKNTFTNLSWLGLDYLYSLDLSSNNLPHLPQHLPKQVDNYYCLSCRMTTLNIEDTGGLKGINTSLNIQYNNIRFIANSTFSISNHLTEIDLQQNNLTCISIANGKVFSRLRYLTELGLRLNPLGCIPINLPPSLLHLDLVITRQTTVKAGLLNHLVNLQTIELWENQISYIADYAFRGLTKVTIMDINTNRIPFINDKTFLGMTGLQTLYAYENNIAYVDKNAFAGMKNLQELWLSGNKIKTINIGLKSTFGLPSVNYVDITFNPFVCDCKLRWMKMFQEQNDKVQDPHLITCDLPTRLHNKAWDQLSYVNFTCSGSTAPHIRELV